MIARATQNGFALVETLIATAIIAVMLGVTLQAIALGARQTRMIEDRRQAMLIAQSQLSAAGAAQSDVFGDSNGLTSGIRWRITRRPYRTDQPSVARLEEVTVTAGRADDPRALIILKTVRVAR